MDGTLSWKMEARAAALRCWSWDRGGEGRALTARALGTGNSCCVSKRSDGLEAPKEMSFPQRLCWGQLASGSGASHMPGVSPDN